MSNVINLFSADKAFVHQEPITDFSASIRRQIESAPLHRALVTAYIAVLENCNTFDTIDRATAINDFGMRSHDPVAIRNCIESLGLMNIITETIHTERKARFA